MAQQIKARRRVQLSRDRVLHAAVALADDSGIESLSMRKLADELGVVPMALYKHVAHKEELLDGMIDVVVGEIDPPVTGTDWKSAVRQRILSARRALLRHPWASRVMESKTVPTPVVLEYMDSMIGMFRAGGFSVNLTHHVMHSIGSRVLGFTQELFNDSETARPEVQAIMLREMAAKYPYVMEICRGGLARGRVGRRRRLRRSVRVRVRPGSTPRRLRKTPAQAVDVHRDMI